MDSKDETHEREEIRKNVRKKILGVIDEIMEEASDGEYIYRGQAGTISKSDVIPKSDAAPQVDDTFPQVTSTLYRALYRALYHAMKKRYEEEKDNEWVNEGANEEVGMNLIQEEALNSARDFTSENYNDDEMLSLIQHYSGDTNLIDFTKDYLIALFFACNQKYGENGKDGKVFLLKTSKLEDNKIKVITPVHPSNRITAQKSIFLQSPTGIIHKDMMKDVTIPLDLKQPILDYLNAHHDISLPSIYNDLHGYIRNRKEHGKAVMEFNLGIYYSHKSKNPQLLEKKSDALKKAMGHFDKAIQLDPKYVRAYSNRGNIKYDYGNAKQGWGDIQGATSDYKKAIKDYDKAIELDPKYANAYYNRGNAKVELGDMSGAIDRKDVISDYDEAIALDPDLVHAYHHRGIAKKELGDASGAISDYDKVIELDPQNAKAYNNRGLAKQKLSVMRGDVFGAISDYDKAVELDPDFAEAYNNRGRAKQGWGDMPGAISDYDKAIELAPEYAEAHYNRGFVKDVLGGMPNLQQALSDFENAKKLALQQNKQSIVDKAQKFIGLVKAKIAEIPES